MRGRGQPPPLGKQRERPEWKIPILRRKRSRGTRENHSELGREDVQEFARVVVEVREDGTQIAGSEVPGDDFAEDAAKVGSNGQVAILIKLLLAHAGPF